MTIFLDSLASSNDSDSFNLSSRVTEILLVV